MTFKPYPELFLRCHPDSSAMMIETKDGMTVVCDENCDEDSLQRLVDCWNACRHIHSPAAHIAATDDYISRLETLRKEAMARVAELEATLPGGAEQAYETQAA